MSLADHYRQLAQRHRNNAWLCERDIETELAALIAAERHDMIISQDQVDAIKASQTQLAQDLADDGAQFRQGLQALRDSFQQQLAAALAAQPGDTTPVDLAEVNANFATLHAQAGSLIDFGTAAGATPPQAPPDQPPVVTDPAAADGSGAAAADGSGDTTPQALSG